MAIVYKLASRGLGMLGGMAAGAVFKRVWKATAGQDKAPDATDRDRGWAEVLTAAAVQGAIFGLVTAAVDRAGAHAFDKATGRWPGD